ncbi:MAG: acyl-CoA carboxylase subunit beta [Acidimicrobiia bacterium]|nr:acyl-CoA carboxylase subunit beta [Acidimicrobiia bacterium]
MSTAPTDGVRDWDEYVGDLEARRAAALEMGGTERVERQHGMGKMTVRERLDHLCDDGGFVEYGRLADHMDESLGDRSLPADGVVTGVGTIDGRRVAIVAYDFTVKGGTMGNVGEMKVTRMRELALRQRIPIVWLIDSAGARIEQSVGSVFAAAGHLFREQVEMSGVVPQVAAMMGPGAAGTAYIPGLADFVPMVEGTSSMALGGPALVKAAVGEDLSEQEIGGAEIHTKHSGVADLAVEDDAACLDAVRRYLSYMPSHNREPAPRVESDDPPDRSVMEARDIVPTAPRRAYDVRGLIEALVDRDTFFPMKPDWAKNLVTGLARFDGRSVGIVANQPIHLGGVLDVDAADKAARFVWLCDAFSIPLVFLVDTPGFLVGSKVERAGIIRHGAKMLFAVSEATVPKVTVVTRKAYGAGYFVMCGRAYEADYLVTWPTAEISVMGPDGAVNILFGKQIEAAPEDQRTEMRLAMAEQIRSQIDPYIAAGWSAVDDVVAPEETRAAICRGLAATASKRVERPWRKHGVLPV